LTVSPSLAAIPLPFVFAVVAMLRVVDVAVWEIVVDSAGREVERRRLIETRRERRRNSSSCAEGESRPTYSCLPHPPSAFRVNDNSLKHM
jgi:hypothetical protein